MNKNKTPPQTPIQRMLAAYRRAYEKLGANYVPHVPGVKQRPQISKPSLLAQPISKTFVVAAPQLLMKKQPPEISKPKLPDRRASKAPAVVAPPLPVEKQSPKAAKTKPPEKQSPKRIKIDEAIWAQQPIFRRKKHRWHFNQRLWQRYKDKRHKEDVGLKLSEEECGNIRTQIQNGKAILLNHFFHREWIRDYAVTVDTYPFAPVFVRIFERDGCLATVLPQTRYLLCDGKWLRRPWRRLDRGVSSIQCNAM